MLKKIRWNFGKSTSQLSSSLIKFYLIDRNLIFLKFFHIHIADETIHFNNVAEPALHYFYCRHWSRKTDVLIFKCCIMKAKDYLGIGARAVWFSILPVLEPHHDATASEN
jgi:hypothetical protein